MNKIRIVSDLHLEFLAHKPYFLEKMKGEQHMHLVLAGDICVWNLFNKEGSMAEFFKDCSERHKSVIYVPGNHEYYQGDILRDDASMLNYFREKFDNIHFLNNETVTIDDIKFIGATLWTNTDFYDAQLYENMMGDFGVIKYGGMPLNITMHTDMHEKSVGFIERNLYSEGKKVVVTHHLPSYKSVHPKFHGCGNNMNKFFYSDLDRLMYKYEPEYWIHGHTHHSFDYMLKKTNVVCNPRDRNRPQRDYDPYLVKTVA